MKETKIYGKIPVKNALVGRRRGTLLYLNGEHPDQELQSLASKNNVRVKLVSNRKLDSLSDNSNHQGAVLIAEDFEYSTLDECLSRVSSKDESTVVILDGIEDPVNFGSIIRSSAAFGVDFIVIGKNRQVKVTPTVTKISTGAENYVPIAEETNLSQSMETLKKNGYWVVCSAGEGKDAYDEIDYSGKIALVIGSEGKGASRLVKERSDFVASIPMNASVSALNASVACAVFLTEINSYRRKHSK